MSASRRSVPTLPIELLRDAVGREVARLSLRGAAKAISVSPNGLRNFLNGSAPRSATRTKLERWLATQDRRSRPPRVGQIVRLVEALSGDLGSHDGVVVGRGIAHLLVEAYGERREPVPTWVKELLAQFDPGKPRP